MAKIIIYYHSGAGATKMVGEILRDKLSMHHHVDMFRVSANLDTSSLSDYDLIVFGFPVFGFAPSPSMREFVESLLKQPESKQCFIYTTLGFLSGNSIYKLVEILKEKNIIPIGFTEIFAPGSDASLMMPASWKWPRSFKKSTARKIATSIGQICININNEYSHQILPKYKRFWGLIENHFLNQ